MKANTKLPLEGIRILELAGPPGTWTTGIFSDFGAEVIKIERFPPVNMEFTSMGVLEISPERQKKRAAFDSTNRNKKSISLNLKAPEAREVFYKLVKVSDIVLEGYRPGVTRRLGIDYETLKKINPRLIYCSITGYGQTGPYTMLPGHDTNYVAMAGVLDLTGNKDGAPIIPGTQVGDWGGGGSQAAIGILLALVAREKTGRGQYIDISMLDGVVSWLGLYVQDYFADGLVPRRGELVPNGGVPYNNVYQTKDGKYISVGCWEPWLYENLCRALGREDFVPYQHDLKKREEIFRVFKDIFKQKTREEWFKYLWEKDVCVAPVNSFSEVVEDIQVKHREMVLELDHPQFGKVKQVGIPVKLSETPGKISSFAPMYSEHTDEIMRTLGYSKEEVEKLREKEAIK